MSIRNSWSSFLLLPSYHTLSSQAAVVNRDGSSAEQRFLIEHEAVDLLGEAGALLLSRGEQHGGGAVV